MQEIRGVLKGLGQISQGLFPAWKWSYQAQEGSEFFLFQPRVPVELAMGRMETNAVIPLTDYERLSQLFALTGIGVQEKALPPSFRRQNKKFMASPIGRLMGGLVTTPEGVSPLVTLSGIEIFQFLGRSRSLPALAEEAVREITKQTPLPLKQGAKPYTIGG